MFKQGGWPNVILLENVFIRQNSVHPKSKRITKYYYRYKSYGVVKWSVVNGWILPSVKVTTVRVCYKEGYLASLKYAFSMYALQDKLWIFFT